MSTDSQIQSNGRRGAAYRIALGILTFVLGSLLPVARAQMRPAITVNIGWPTGLTATHDGRYRVDHYVPVHVDIQWVASNRKVDWPARFNAEVVVDCQQSYELTTSTVSPVTLERGAPTRRTVYIRSTLPIDSSPLRVRLRDDDDRTLSQWESNVAWSNTIVNATAVQADQALAIVVGRTTFDRAGWLWSDIMTPVHCCHVDASWLPSTWIGYDGVSIVVMGEAESDRLTAGQIQSLQRWVMRGGELIILAGASRATLDAILAPLPEGLIVGDYGPSEVTFDLRSVGEAALDDLAPDSTNTSDDEESPEDDQTSRHDRWRAALGQAVDDASAAPLQNVYRRTFELSESLQSSGWRVSSVAGKSRDRVDAESSLSGDIMYIPFGAGRVTILGFEPGGLIRGGNDVALGVAWWAALRDVGSLRAAFGAADPNSMNLRWGAYRPNLAIADAARNRLLDRASEGLGASSGMLVPLAITMVALALLVGPFDRIVFRRLKRLPLTWISCPVWTAMACGAILAIQMLASRGELAMRRLSVIDIPPGATIAHATTISAVSAARQARYRISGVDVDRHFLPAKYNDIMYYIRSRALDRNAIRVTQAGDRTTLSPFYLGAGEVAWAEDRALIDRPDITATVDWDGEGRPVVKLENPTDWVVRSIVASNRKGHFFIADAIPSHDQTALRQGVEMNRRLRSHNINVDDSQYPWQLETHVREWSDHELLFRMPGTVTPVHADEYAPVIVHVAGYSDEVRLERYSGRLIGKGDWTAVPIPIEHEAWIRLWAPVEARLVADAVHHENPPGEPNAEEPGS